MPRDLTPGLQAAAEGQRSEVVHLLELEFAAGTVRFTTGAQNLVFQGETYFASGSAMGFEAVSESADPSGQRLRLLLDGVNLTAINALLAQDYLGRLGRLWRAHFDVEKRVVPDPILLFLGYMNAPWQVTENWDERTAKVETELVSPLAIGGQRRGIYADENSHRAFFPDDTFFSHISLKPEGDFGWGFGNVDFWSPAPRPTGM